MSLDWDATRVKDYDKLTDDEAVLREALIWITIPVGLPGITDENAEQFFTRASFVEKVSGPSRYDTKDGEKVDVYLTPEDVLRFVGLRTNASRLTDAQFRKNQFDFHTRWSAAGKWMKAMEAVKV